MTVGITLAEAQQILNSLLAAAKTNTLAVKYKDDEVKYFNSRAELDASIEKWDRIVKQLHRQQSGGSGHNWARARFV
jgi:hypothetical protein